MVNRFKKRIAEYRFSGFGSKTENEPNRLVNQDGTLNVGKTGLKFLDHFSVFHFLVNTRWTIFNTLVLISYVSVVFLFSIIYFLIGNDQFFGNANTFGDQFLQAFYFSAQTFSTVGYGRFNPSGNLINLISVVEMLVGMMYVALATGLLFARFSRPVAKVIFSENALISPYKGGRGLMMRITNAKSNLLMDVHVRVLLTMKLEVDGKMERKFYILPLEMEMIDILALSWTVVHPINEDSPLWGMTEEEFSKTGAELMVLINGHNDTLSQNIHARSDYKQNEVVWGAKFSSIFSAKNGKTYVDVSKVGKYDYVEI